MKVQFTSDGGSIHARTTGGDDSIHARTNCGNAISGNRIISHITAYWNAQPQLISEKNTIYVYTDHQSKELPDGTIEYIPSFKIGDGNAYLIDLPFTDELFTEHIENEVIHITAEEREFWNNKVRAYALDEQENLVLTIH